MKKANVWDLEKKMISTDEWYRVPSHIVDMVHEEIETGHPVGFAYDEDLGWCILGTGQGPFIIYIEREL